MKPYYDHAGITMYLGDCLELADVWTSADALICDPPYGMAFVSNQATTLTYAERQARKVAGDDTTAARDRALELFLDAHGFEPNAPRWLMFGRWDCPRPRDVTQLLIWHKAGNGPGMGNTERAFGLDHEEIYLGGDWPRREGIKRTGSVISTPGSQSIITTAIGHPTPKPVPLMEQFVRLTSPDDVIADPFAGSGSTLVAASRHRRKAVGVEIEERYAEIIARRLQAESEDLFGSLLEEN